MYFGLFENEKDVCDNFNIDSVDGAIIFAAYEYEDYSGSADVIFMKDGKYFHVSGSHCSCYGLEDQWAPEEMPVDVLRHMARAGSFGRGSDQSILNALNALEALDLQHASLDVAKVAARLAWM